MTRKYGPMNENRMGGKVWKLRLMFTMETNIKEKEKNPHREIWHESGNPGRE